MEILESRCTLGDVAWFEYHDVSIDLVPLIVD
jgi:hypothetical protein